MHDDYRLVPVREGEALPANPADVRVLPEFAPRPRPSIYGTVDIALAGLALALTLAVCIPASIGLQQQARSVEVKTEAVREEIGDLKLAVAEFHTRRQMAGAGERGAERYVAMVEARAGVPWSTAVSEISRQRPGGVWAQWMTCDGGKFKMGLAAKDPTLVKSYLARLGQSPMVEYVSRLDGGDSVQIYGRFNAD